MTNWLVITLAVIRYDAGQKEVAHTSIPIEIQNHLDDPSYFHQTTFLKISRGITENFLAYMPQKKLCMQNITTKIKSFMSHRYNNNVYEPCKLKFYRVSICFHGGSGGSVV